MKLRQLKVKVKSLASEQRIIRHEEHAALAAARWQRPNLDTPIATGEREALRAHRVHHVRPEARAANIAYGLLKGRALEQIEQPRSKRSLARKPYREPDWPRIARLMTKYGPTVVSVETIKLAA